MKPKVEELVIVPDWAKKDAADCARQLVGSHYVEEYYRQIAQDFLWLYECGYRDGKNFQNDPAHPIR